MAAQESVVQNKDLQFDRVTESAAGAAPSAVAVTCTACHSSIDTRYYQINGHVLCSKCRYAVQSSAETPRGIAPLIIAGLFGLGAGLVGAAIYYAVIAIANLEIGIVAILIGYMVGYSVRKGAGGRGGLRFQVLAVALTYSSIALAYAPLAFRQPAADQHAKQAQTSTTTSGSNQSPAAIDIREPAATPAKRSVVFAFAVLLVFIVALPVVVVVGSFPSGLISAVIIAIGMRQAWRMTGAPSLEVLGPFRVGAVPAPTRA